MAAVIPDPWRPVVAPPRRGSLQVARQVAVVLLGALGPAWAVWSHGPEGRRGALGLVAAATCWGLVARLVPRLRGWTFPALGAVVVIGAAFTVPSIGRAPLLVVLVGTSVAQVALFGWPWSRAHVPEGSVLAVPLLVVALVLAHREVSTAVVLGVLVLAAAVVALSWWRPRLLAPPARAVDRGARAMGRGALAVILFVVTAVFVYLPGLVVRLASTFRAPPDSNWSEPSSPPTQRRDASVPFASPPRSVLVRRHVTSAVVVVALIGLVVMQRADRSTPDPTGTPDSTAVDGPSQATTSLPDQTMAGRIEDVPYADRPAFEGQPQLEELQAETAVVPLVDDPDLGYVLGDVEGEVVNVVDGSRSTLATSCDGCPEVDLWLAGGSLVFGIGQRDDHTVASALVREFAEDGIALNVRNLGVPGWTIVQEQDRVDQLLAGGEDPPDLIVFYDGFNDTVATLLDQIFGGGIPDEPARLDPDLAEQLIGDAFADFPDFSGSDVGAAAGERYRATARPFDASLREQGIEVIRVFQPDASSSAEQREGVEALDALPADFYEISQLDAVLAAAATELAGDATVADARDILDPVDHPVFIDTSHVSEEGASLLAAELHARIAEQVRALAD